MIAKLIATAGGVGYCPWAPGTAGSLLGWLIGWLAALHQPPMWRWLMWTAAVLIGVAASTRTERVLGRHDPSVVVIDEVVGMWMVLILLPREAHWLVVGVAAFVLFRAFDVVKPPPLRWFSRAPGGWGIVLDDLGAAVYTWLVLFVLNCAFQVPGPVFE